jgi:hypothetical protein
MSRALIPLLLAVGLTAGVAGAEEPAAPKPPPQAKAPERPRDAPPPELAGLSEEDREVVENLELLENLDAAQDLELLEELLKEE